MRRTRRIKKLVITLVVFSVLGGIGAVASSHSTARLHWYAGQSGPTASGTGGHWGRLA